MVGMYCKNLRKVLYADDDLQLDDWVIDVNLNIYIVTDTNPKHSPDSIGAIPKSWVIITKEIRDEQKKNSNRNRA